MIGLLIFLPTVLFIEKKIIFNKVLIKKINIIIAIIIFVFLTRNVLRINKEIDIYNFNFYKNASYNKIFQNIDLDQTPLPILVFFFLFMGFLFLFIGLLSQLILSTKEDKISNEIHIKEKIENNL